ncbi:hypothetical protein ACIP9G_01250 [Lysinibacillus sp. NPDC093197]|uniref:hypothetical protein n=1 Tax=Lysinibacillus sp. NPDC093197 TaxID=3364132 RepID=UPI00380E567D
MEALKGITDILQSFTPLTLGITLVVYIIFDYINNHNVTEIEIKLMSPKRKFLMLFSKNIIPSIIISIIGILVSIDTVLKQIEELNLKDLMSLNTYLLIIFILFVVILFAVSYFTQIFFRVIEFIVGINYDYFIEDEKGTWRIIRTNNLNKVVVRCKEEIKFIENPYEHEYVEKIISSKRKLELYKNDKTVKNTYSSLLLAALILLIVFIGLFSMSKISFIAFMLLSFLCITLVISGLIIINSKLDYDRQIEQGN